MLVCPSPRGFTRRHLLSTLPALGASLTLPSAAAHPAGAVGGVEPSARTHTPLLNHLGYRVRAPKHLMTPRADGRTQARLLRVDRGHVGEAATVPLTPGGRDFGQWLLADFSAVQMPGLYRAAVPFQFFSGDASSADDWTRGVVDAWSHTFHIGEDVHDEVLRAMVNYYRVQSCGASPKGYNTPCHTGPIGRDDGGPARPIPGGWHSAHDHVRDLPEILHGLFGLLALAEARPGLAQDEDLFHEIRWGNDYFLAIQEPGGHVPFGVYPRDYFNLKNTWDTREFVLITRPAPRYCQHLFIAAQATVAHVYREADPAYAARCLAAGERCFDRAAGRKPGTLNVYDLGTGAFAAGRLFRVTAQASHRESARTFARALVDEQTSDGDWREVAGMAADPHPDYDLLNARALYPAYAPVGLAAVLQALPGDPDAPRWRDALTRFRANYIGYFAGANGYGIAPQAPYLPASDPRTRTWGGRCFRYFLDSGTTVLRCPGTRPIPWQAGHNGIVAGYGVALSMMATLMGDREAASLAQRQWDWIAGLNPLDTCHLLGFGRNNPVTFPPVASDPPVPDIQGAGLQGFVGADDDQPTVVGGYYGTGEFWMPQHSWTLWLAALLSAEA